MKPISREWAKKAEDDFKVASQILRRRKDIVPDAACFFSQQCVEKYLKARLIEAGIVFPRTHDLLQLLNLCLPVEPLWSLTRKRWMQCRTTPWIFGIPATLRLWRRPGGV